MRMKNSKAICLFLATVMMCINLAVFSCAVNDDDTTSPSSAIVVDPLTPVTDEEKPTETAKPTKPVVSETVNDDTTKHNPTEDTTEQKTTTNSDDDDEENTTSRDTGSEEEPDDDTPVYTPADDTPGNDTKTESTTAETLPEGSFYVYLELNNGSKRLKHALSKPGLVPEPQEPTRKGYKFAGWYADERFTTEWSFFTDSADKEMIIYAKWVSDGSLKEYSVSVKNSAGGKLQANPAKAKAGEIVTVTVTPDDGKVLKVLMINGKATDIFSFEMPESDVVITAEFTESTITENQSVKNTKLIVLLVFGIVIVAGGVTATIFVLRRRRGVPIPKDSEDWSDKEAVVEEGFKEGRKVKENTEPDFEDVNDFLDD